jgi:hypothetical protein
MNNDNVEDREILNTQDMIEQGFLSRLGNKMANLPKKVAATEESEYVEQPKTVKYNTEKLLLSLYEVKDGLIDTYAKIGVGAYSKNFVDSINKVGACIQSLGGESEAFDAFAHMSGLQAPSLNKNAKRVVENTIEAYTLGKISDPKIEDKTITLSFTGQRDSVNYKAVGTLVASKTWVGNEAIDYVYTPGEGRMSVKVFTDDGKWMDKSANYQISWELFESENDFDVMPTEGGNDLTKDAKNKEEVKKTAENNIEDDIDDFEI